MRLFFLGLSLCVLGSACRDACDARSGSFEDADEDGVCDELDACEGSDDTEDADGDGVPDDCDLERLATVSLTEVNMDAPVEGRVRVWLAYDAVGSLQSWTAVNPGWTFDSDSLREPVGHDTYAMSGWTAFEEALVNGSNDELAIVIEGVEDTSVRIIEKDREQGWRIGNPDLAGSDVRRIEVAVTGWRTEVNSVISVEVGFLGL